MPAAPSVSAPREIAVRRQPRRGLWLSAMGALALAACAPGSAINPGGDGLAGDGLAGDALLPDSFVDASYGGHGYKLYTPPQLDPATQRAPLLVVLHGCGQSPQEMADLTGINALAAVHHLFVLYPEQSAAANVQRCWRWFDALQQSRSGSEPAWLAELTEFVTVQQPVDSARRYVIGMSAGAAMAVILGATYPDLFAAVGSVAGLEFGAASSALGASTAMLLGGPAPAVQGAIAHAAMGIHARVMPVILFQGTADGVVAPVNVEQLVGQWAQTNDLAFNGVDDDAIDAVADDAVDFSPAAARLYRVESFYDAAATPMIEAVTITGAGHAWPGASGLLGDPLGPDATAMIWQFLAGLRAP